MKGGISMLLNGALAILGLLVGLLSLSAVAMVIIFIALWLA